MSPHTSNKERATDFLALVAAGQVEQAFAKHVAADFRHHNPFFPGDRLSLLRAMQDVVAYSRVTTGTLQIAVVHILRFNDGMITELWDIGQMIPPVSPNSNGMF